MKSLSVKHLLSWTMCAISMLAMMTSCSGSSDMTKLIPADSQVVVRLNLRQPLENGGFTVDNNSKITLPKAVSKQLSAEESMQLQLILGMIEGLDIAEGYFFVYDNDPTAIIRLTDTDKVEKRLTQFFGKPDKKNGYDYFNIYGGFAAIAIKDNILWATNVFGNIEKINKAAGKKSIAEVAYINDLLADNDNCLAVAVPAKQFGVPALSKYWVCGSMKFEDDTSTAQLLVADADGQRYPIGESFDEVDPNVVSYFPNNTNIVAALGNIKDSNLKEFIQTYANQLGQFAFLLEDLNGTFAAGAYANVASLDLNSLQDILDVDFTILAHYPKATIEKATNFFANNFEIGSGTPVTKLANGTYSTKVNNSLTIYFGGIDDYLVFASQPLAKTGNTAFRKDFAGARAVLAQKLSVLPCSPMVVESCITLDKDCINCQSKVTGTGLKYIESYIDLFTNPKTAAQARAAVKKAILQAMEESGFYGGYNYDNDDDDDLGCEYDADDDLFLFDDNDTIAEL